MRLAPKGWFGLRDGIVMTVVDVIEQQSIVLRMTPPEHVWDAVWSFHLIPHWEDRCRLLIRTRIRLRHPGEVLATELAGPAKALTDAGDLVGHQTSRGGPSAGRPPRPAVIFTASSRPSVSNASEFTVGLGAKGKSPARDAQRTDSYVVLLHRRGPGK